MGLLYIRNQISKVFCQKFFRKLLLLNLKKHISNEHKLAHFLDFKCFAPISNVLNAHKSI
jgi:hypothetical protein